MADNLDEALAALSARLGTLEETAATYLGDHTAWLLAMQAIVAVSLVRHLATSSDPQGFMRESEAWSRQIVSNTTTSALPEEAAEKIRRRALEKVEQFFRGIALHQP
jgi:hypothetical protein